MKKLNVAAMNSTLPGFPMMETRIRSRKSTNRTANVRMSFFFLSESSLRRRDAGMRARTVPLWTRQLLTVFVLFAYMVIAQTGAVPGMMPARVQAREMTPVLAEHSPHIRQWWQFWGQKETGRGMTRPDGPVFVRFRTDMLGTHVGRLFVEFAGEQAQEVDHAFSVYAIAVPRWGRPPVSIPVPLRTDGKKISGAVTVNSFGADIQDVYLSVRQIASNPAGMEFRYTATFVFSESVGGEEVPWTAPREGVRPKNDEKVGFEVFGIPTMDEQNTRVAPKIYNMRNPWQKTTTMEAEETRHSWWEWQWGDGEVTYDRDPLNTVGTMERVFTKAGEYVVKAISYAETGEVILEKVWHFVLDATSIHLPQSFNFETIGLVNPEIEIIGPRAWITGRPAQYQVKVDYVEPPFGDTVITSIKPSENFQMVWDKPGRQTLTVAVAAVTTYKFPKGGQISVRNVYTHSIEIEVATLAISE